MKYIFKPYSRIFEELFSLEKSRISKQINKHLDIQHVGSTAVPGLGGKGIIDIALAVEKSALENTCAQLQELGYEYRADWSTQERLYFKIDLPDKEKSHRKYHVHLTYLESVEWKNLIWFRDYLRSHPVAIEEYARIKKIASELSQENGVEYRRIKDPFIKSILDKSS